ncbi:hypothetical protein N7468_000759 [Penicillium chermesinum]|uniref:Uncharacterized protein n=1 Tax=Penicillium chermesinum TaxID=63820 RepID=A0A9W9PML3_9EURO|nr:uncharacterized protein N7468_000759 [Penicillium chermesinum]KAJ5249308.1 hypothetical protein N7468_000759 [Penicillium chermesinum]
MEETPLSPRDADAPFEWDDQVVMACIERDGYFLVNSKPAKREALEWHFALGDTADHLSRSNLSEVRTCTDNQKAWEQLIEADLNINGLIILPHFHSPAEVIRQGPIIHNLAFVIWRPITRSLGPEDGLFKVYPESHNIRTEEELHRKKIDAISFPIRADQFLVAHGGLWIQQGGTGSGLLMWAGLSTEIIGLHVDKRSLDFVALAYGAGRFLGGIVHSASHTLEKTEAFLKGLSDPTSLILNSEYGMHPRIAYANVRVQDREGHSTDPELERYFLSALTIRSLLRRLRETPGETNPGFTRKEGLPDETLVKHAILTGRKMYFVETEKSEPGLWLALMSVLPKLQHMPIWQVKLIPDLLNEQPRILDAGKRWSRYMSQSSQLYEIWVRELLQGSNPT